jgi:hypothetical protein
MICTQQFKKLPLFVPAVYFVQNILLPVESVSSQLNPKVFCGDKTPYRHVRGTVVLSALKMEAVGPFEMLVPSYWTKRYIPEESKLHFHHPENFKSHSTERILHLFTFFEDILLISFTFVFA